ncbi:MAG: tRNA (cytosine(32)/uridine(32)-2'-O)-methyltransferase TrmJ [Rhodospirillaceae bacterium]|nr:tRNA (cytosine(32)/uridine(32)-2'-O)-methyltransferase TrmJ [Rhodospirillaceae bacterium]|tara:strand:+ start:7141 stop:7920 length:780 start_codon:yes stop_codon:yes gene_type:complete
MHVPVRIVLVETSHPGNIGASARAMKTMGLDDLVLVAPKEFPSVDATARASGADDVLAKSKVVGSLIEAIADCGFVVGSSARLRSLSWPMADSRSVVEEIWSRIGQTKVAIVFGPEHSGLSNEDLSYCQRLVHVPANPDYSSLNIAMAVQVLCYELRMGHPDLEKKLNKQKANQESPPANAEELQGFYLHLEQLLQESGFLDPNHPRQLKLRLRRIFHRAELDKKEVNILRGMLTALTSGTSQNDKNKLSEADSVEYES